MKRHHIFLALFVSTYCLAAEQLPEGTWVGGDTAAESIYGYMKISSTHLTWGDPARKYAWCSQPYQLLVEPPDAKFTDYMGVSHVVSELRDSKTYRIRFTTARCNPSLSGLRLTFELGTQLFFLIEYDLKGQEVGWMHFNVVPAGAPQGGE
jgi:hypothetical protein